MAQDSRIRIGYCIDSFAVGGTELNAVRTAEALDRDKFELCVVHFQADGPLRPRYQALDVRMVHLPISGLISLKTAAQGRALAALWRRWSASVVHTHDVYTNVFAVPWTRLFSDSRIISSRRWWKVVPRRGLSTANRWSYSFADRVLANSAAVAELLRREEGVPAVKVVTIPNFLSDDAFEAPPADVWAERRAQWGIPTHGYVVGIVARLAPVKNHVLLVRVAALLPDDYHFVLVGEGPSRASIEQLTRDCGVADRFHLLGELTSAPSPHHFFDASVLCSTSEGFPNSLIEAMAAARPVLATAVGGVTDVVVDGVNGRLIPLDDPEFIARRLIELRNDSSLSRNLGESGQRLVRERYSRARVIESLSTLYATLAQHARGRS